MSYHYVEQDDLETVKAWFERTRRQRKEEAERLEQRLDEATAELDEYEIRLEARRERKANQMFPNNNLAPSAMDESIERYYRSLRQKVWDLKRQLRDLIRWDRDDLEWLATLERKEREANKQYRPSNNEVRQQQRAENWRAKKQAMTEE